MRSWRTHLPGPRADALLPQARLAGPMPWVIAIMVTLTVIAVAGGLALSNIVQQARSDLAGGLTVQIVNADPVGRARDAEAARRAPAKEKPCPHIIPNTPWTTRRRPHRWTRRRTGAAPSGCSLEACVVAYLLDCGGAP